MSGTILLWRETSGPYCQLLDPKGGTFLAKMGLMILIPVSDFDSKFRFKGKSTTDVIQLVEDEKYLTSRTFCHPDTDPTLFPGHHNIVGIYILSK